MKHRFAFKYSSQNIYSMKIILIHKKYNPFVKYGHLHPEYAGNLVTNSEYYHCRVHVDPSCLTVQ